jgi:16S rRNA processing protein RimM
VTPPEPAELIAVGRITRAHGIHGFVAVLPLSEILDRFAPGSELLLGAEARRPVVVAERRGQEHRPLIRFEGIPDRTAAEGLAAEYLFVPAASSPPLPAGSFWPHDLIGLRAVTTGGTDLGTIREILQNVANDIWVARTDDGAETLIPALKDIVLDVDVDSGAVTVAQVPGLTVPEEARTDGR